MSDLVKELKEMGEGGLFLKLSELPDEKLLSIQKALEVIGFNPGPLDGLYGRRTSTAWSEFKEANWLGQPEFIGDYSLDLLIKLVGEVLGKTNPPLETKEDVIKAIISECSTMGLSLPTQIAYVLATVEHETNKTFMPVREAYWLSDSWRKSNLRYYPYYGRGYVQITWKTNYEKYSKLTGRDLVGNPDLAMEPDVALFILVHGCKTGSFTGRKLEDYINPEKTDYYNARRVINALDKAFDIEKLAEKWESTI